MYLLKNSWQFSSELLKTLRAFLLKNHKRITYVRVILILCILRFCDLFCKDSSLHSFKAILSSYHYTKLRAILCSVQTHFASSFGDFRP